VKCKGGKELNGSCIHNEVDCVQNEGMVFFFALGIATEILFVLQVKKIVVDSPTQRGMPKYFLFNNDGNRIRILKQKMPLKN
jgi:hypothetical protein